MNTDTFLKNCPKEIDLTNDKHADIIIEVANEILKEHTNPVEIQKLETEISNRNEDGITALRLALKLAQSKSILKQIDEEYHISVVFAVYKEHQRILTKAEHPNGENFLVKKVQQMQWLFDNQTKISWDLTVVDDGCPEGSGKIAQQIISDNNLSDKVKVLFLKDAINKPGTPIEKLNSTNESQKGGSILYGMHSIAGNTPTDNHIVVFTDADLSTHLGQLMLLAEPIIAKKQLSAIGSRREKLSVVVKKSSRNNRGKLFIYLWKRMIPTLNDIIDTQCGFKAFKANIIPVITMNNIEQKFAFDVELLIKTTSIKNNSITKVPIAWIDSDAESTTTDLQPYLPMLKAIAKMQKKYLQGDNTNNPYVEFVESLDDEKFNKLLQNIPENITNKDPEMFSTFSGVTVEELRQSID